MILFVSDGRLGNQLFQYAFLKRIQKPKEMILAYRMDAIRRIFDFDQSNFRSPKLSSRGFRIFDRFVEPIFRVLSRIRLIGMIEELRKDGRSSGEFLERNGLLPFRFLSTAFFQSEAFIAADSLDLNFKTGIEQIAKEFMTQLPGGVESVFVHIRRGDYLKESYMGEKGIELPISYYEKAIKLIGEKLTNPYFIFLSDEIDYCRNHFQHMENAVFSSESQEVDLAIMSQCQHAIIANSSFSWWGAYFIEQKGTIIYPKYWYGWKFKEDSHPAIYPSYGIAIEVN